MEGVDMQASRRILLCVALTVLFLSSMAPLAAVGGGTRTELGSSGSAASPLPRNTPRVAAPAMRSPQASPAEGGSGVSGFVRVLDAAAGDGAQASLAQPSLPVQSGWNALNVGDDVSVNGVAYFPPDVQVAAGPTDVVEMVNLVMGVYTKQGAQVSMSSLVTLFNSGSDFISDPKVQYDAASARWFATVTDVTRGQVLMAVSGSSDPTASWHVTPIPSSSTHECLDQPILGVGTATVIVSVNVFSQTKNNPCTTPYVGAQYWVVNKTDLVNGVAAPAMNASAVDVNEGSIHPVQMEGSSAVHYMVSTYWPGTATTSSTLHFFTVSGTPPAAVTVSITSRSMPTAAMPPPASQAGTGRTIDTADLRISDAAWAAGKLWLGFDEACLSDATRACIRMVEYDTATSTILQDFDIDVAGKDVFYPAFRMDGTGGLVVVFGYSSSTDYPGIMATGRLSGDLADTLQPPSVVALGTGPENPSGCSGTCRYGDYFGAGLDPSNASLVWMAGEFGTPSGWSTHIFASGVKAALTLDYQVVGGGSGYPVPTLSYTSNAAVLTVPLTASPTAYYADPGTPWSVTPILENPASRSETWGIDTLAADQPYAGIANASLAVTYTYYHQYSVRLGYAVHGWNPQLALPAAKVNVTVFGRPVSVFAGAVYDLDAGTTFTYENPLSVSTASDRVLTEGATTGTVTGALNLTLEYYHQYRVTFVYLLAAAGASSSPTVQYFNFGSNTSAQLNATVWADAGQSYVYASSLTSGGGSVRIGAGSDAVGTVTAAGTITVVYHLQFLLRVFVEPGSLGDSVRGAGWYDAGSVAFLTATAPGGWEFVSWSGDAAGADANVSVTMSAPGNVTAVFYPGLTIVAGDGGSVAYRYGAFSGVVPAGASVTVYAPVGTAVTLTAQPSSWTDVFVSWGGAGGGAAENLSFTLSGPVTVSASFGTNVLVIAGLVGGVLAAILAAFALILATRRRRRPPPA